MKGHWKPIFILLMLAAALAGCSLPGQDEEGTGEPETARNYCTESGGVVETRHPFYGTNSEEALRLAGSLDFCAYTAGDGSRIVVGLGTLYALRPTLAAAAYRAALPMEAGEPSANPSSLYCSQLGGTDTFGGINAAGGGWGLEEGEDVIAMCVFPDMSTIDSWGLAYHSDGVIRGADLTDLFRYQPEGEEQLFP